MRPWFFEAGEEEDFAEALAYYREESDALAGRLYDEIHRLIADVCATPRLFRLVAKPLRRHFSETFPYAILYVENPDSIAIYAVAHFKRRPGYWRERPR